MPTIIAYKICAWLCIFRFAEAALSKQNFTEDFLFGVGSSAFQIEGAWNENGKGESIWDYWTHTRPAFVLDLSNADRSTDAYHHLQEDTTLLKYLGVDFYRFSISWPRILPSGTTNRVNQDGLNYYRSLLQELRSNGISAMVVLFNWDIPKDLHLIGGWANEVIVELYVDYAKLVVDAFGDVVDFWLTFHDPYSVCTQGGWMSGVHDYVCMRNVLRAHARVYHYYKEETNFEGRMSINFNANWYEANSTSVEDEEAAERMIQFMLGWYANPIFSTDGNYPDVMIETIDNKSLQMGFAQSRLPELSSDEIDYIVGTADFFALSHFTTFKAANAEDGVYESPSFMADAGVIISDEEDEDIGASDWLRVVPRGFRSILNWIQDSYNVSSIYVTGNGYSDNGELEDEERVSYHQVYLSALLDAIYLDGVNVVSYAAWSFLDSFEWREGYSHRFGLYHVDFKDENRTRTPKHSTEVYKEIIARRRL